MKVKVKVQFTLEQAMKAQKGGRGIALLFFSLTWTPDGGGWSVPRPGRFKVGEDPVPIVQETGSATGPV